MLLLHHCSCLVPHVLVFELVQTRFCVLAHFSKHQGGLVRTCSSNLCRTSMLSRCVQGSRIRLRILRPCVLHFLVPSHSRQLHKSCPGPVALFLLQRATSCFKIIVLCPLECIAEAETADVIRHTSLRLSVQLTLVTASA